MTIKNLADKAMMAYWDRVGRIVSQKNRQFIAERIQEFVAPGYRVVVDETGGLIAVYHRNNVFLIIDNGDKVVFDHAEGWIHSHEGGSKCKFRSLPMKEE